MDQTTRSILKNMLVMSEVRLSRDVNENYTAAFIGAEIRVEGGGLLSPTGRSPGSVEDALLNLIDEIRGKVLRVGSGKPDVMIP